MLSRTSEYALRALIHLAEHQAEWPIAGSRIAAAAGVPAKYLSKILGDLVRAGVLESSPGKTGGFRLSRPAKKVSLLDVLSPFEPFDRRRCPFGNHECSDANPCRAHDGWKKVVETQQRFLLKTSVYDIAEREAGVSSGRVASRGRKSKKP